MSDLEEFFEDIRTKCQIEHEAVRQVAEDYLDNVDRVIAQQSALSVSRSADQMVQALIENPT